MKKRIFPFIIALSALSVSASAAFYSVFGLSKLFAGAATQVIIMAGSLEFAKLVVASILYQYWKEMGVFIKGYLIIATIVLMTITSGGIYGFLSGAYQETATKSTLLDKSVTILEHKKLNFIEKKDDLKLEKKQLVKSISDLRVAMSNPSQIQYVDKESGQLITTTSSSARRDLQSELKETIIDRDNINLNIDVTMDSINSIDIRILNEEIGNEAASELGPLKYLAELTGKSMDVVINWFLLLIIFVFDPLAITLVIVANMAFDKIRKPEEEVITEKNVNSITEEDEKRMVIIGQNGNDGLHYGDNEVISVEQLTEISTKAGIMERERGIPITPTDENLKDMEDYLNSLTYLGKEEDMVNEVIEDELGEPTEEDDEESFKEYLKLVEEEEKRLKIKFDDVSLDDGKKILTYRKRK